MKINNGLSAVLCALLLCSGIGLTSCERADLQGGDDNGGKAGALSWSLEAVTEVSATFTGLLDVPVKDLPFSQVAVCYSDAEYFNINDARKVSTTEFDADRKFTITVTGLKPNVKYNYCLIAEVKSEKIYGDVEAFTTATLVAPTLYAATSITHRNAIVSGKINFLSERSSDLECGIEYSTSQDFTSDVTSKEVTEVDMENNFSVEITSLASSTTYYYRSYIRMGGVTVNGEPKSFRTLQHLYESESFDLNIASATDLSSSSSANCYIVSEAGLYKFKSVKGNSTTNVGSVASASILWETFGTSETPECLDFIKAFCYKDGYIAFQTADTFKEGNAVIAAKDASGKILWSWHIWFTDAPKAQRYNDAGTMMDRNLGAVSATPGDVGALGLLYQWGRKDPFLGSSSIKSDAKAKSTVSWPSSVSSDSYKGTIDYATANPTTFVTYNSKNYDWYYTGSESTDNTRWTTSDKAKSIYDPCPAGWRVPDGGENGFWSKAFPGFDKDFDVWNRGENFGNGWDVWYPASGYLGYYDGSLSDVGYGGYYWSASPYSYAASSLDFSDSGFVFTSFNYYRAYGQSVRCLQE